MRARAMRSSWSCCSRRRWFSWSIIGRWRRDAIARAGGFRLSDGFISPLDLVAIGLVEAEEAKELHELETAGAATE